MTVAQKVIKYLALALALLIISTIINAICVTFSVISGIGSNTDSVTKLTSTELENTELSILSIDLASISLEIKKGDTLSYETNSKYIKVKQTNNKLIIEEKKHNYLTIEGNEKITIYIPNNTFDIVDISAGAGKVDIDSIITKEFNFEMGAGKTNISNLVVLNDTNISGGAGKLTISAGSLHNLDFEMGVGKTTLICSLTGKADIEAGVGELNINLTDSMDNYTIEVSKGIGSISLNGKSLNDDDIEGNGINEIEIDGGIGSIKITTN